MRPTFLGELSVFKNDTDDPETVVVVLFDSIGLLRKWH